MWPLVILGAAAWYLTRPNRNPQLPLWDTMPEPRRSAPEERTARDGKAHATEAATVYPRPSQELAAARAEYREAYAELDKSSRVFMPIEQSKEKRAALSEEEYGKLRAAHHKVASRAWAARRRLARAIARVKG